MSLIIAEIGQAHDGSLGSAHAYIEALSDTDVDAIKFQTHVAEAESSLLEPFRVKFSKQDKTRFDYWKRMEFSLEQWKELKNHCDEVNLEFLSSPFSNVAVDILEEVGVNRYKIGSGEITNFLLLEKIAKTKKPVILSSGMSSFNELDSAVEFLKTRKVEVSVLQCTTAYPTKPELFGLNVIQELKNRYNVKVGFSDHSGKKEACIAAAALGAEIFEFHAVFSRNQFGPDTSSSLTIEEIKELSQSIKSISRAMNNPIDKNDNSSFEELKKIFEKTLSVNKDLKKGYALRFSDLEGKKPARQGISAALFRDVIGKTLKKDINKWEFLTENHINE